ncbi:MAG TPA: hypothetical protein VLH10_09905 [Yinghuangia sp.]|nr:hypothetical protein [Yinghuangia sp.]
MPKPAKRADVDRLFVTPAQFRVQSPAETHEYKKVRGSSDGMQTYDTTAR